MNFTTYEFKFAGGTIRTTSFTLEQCTILAQAEAIKRAWDYTILGSVKIK